jgi:hypothetical protein
MPPHDVEVTGDSTKLVHLDCDDYHLDYLVWLIYRIQKEYEWSWKDLAGVLRIGKRYQFIHIPDLVLPVAWKYVFHRYCAVDADMDGASETDIRIELWEIFVFAATNDFIHLAKLVISAFHHSNFSHNGHRWIPIQSLEELPFRYAIAFVNAVADHDMYDEPIPHIRRRNISECLVLPRDDD